MPAQFFKATTIVLSIVYLILFIVMLIVMTTALAYGIRELCQTASSAAHSAGNIPTSRISQYGLSLLSGRKTAPRIGILDLPPEIRNMIWKLALREDHDIIVYPGLKQPHLLMTCRQIRSETRMMWYMLDVNYFLIRVDDCDSRLALLWTRHLLSIFPVKDVPSVGHMICDSPNWTNLLKWAKGVYELKLGFMKNPELVSDLSRVERVVFWALFVASRMNISTGKSWEEVEVWLTMNRGAVGRRDWRWYI